MSANEKQVGGNHYQQTSIQHWDWVAANDFDYFQGQITKYVARWKKKNGLADLEKALHFLEKYIEIVKFRSPVNKVTLPNTDPLPNHLPRPIKDKEVGMYAPFGWNPEID